MNKTPKPENYIIDATGKTLGRLAVEIAVKLRGKNRPEWMPHIDMRNTVTVNNFASVKFSGKKPAQKIYYKHSDWVGGMKETSLEKMMAKNPTRVLQLAVARMLPDNKLRARQLKRLKINQ